MVKILGRTTAVLLVCLMTFYNVEGSKASAEGGEERVSADALEQTSNDVEFGGSEYRLLDTYAHPEKALAEHESVYGAELAAIQAAGHLPSLTVDTATAYKNVAGQLVLDGDESFLSVLAFLDIYENEAENSLIAEELKHIEDDAAAGTVNDRERLALGRMVLPTRDENGNTEPVYTVRNSGIYLQGARAYAENWAWKANPRFGEERGWWSGAQDCTNFVSQVLHAGGVPMDVTSSEHTGWWWKGKKNRSVSWINANTFKNYMGSNYNTRNWRRFVNNVRDGDFIGADYGRDGTVDHLAFVHTKRDGRLRIAQHTTNYLDWDRGWSSIGRKGVYYRVRR